jgi:hypothetical protein
MRRNQMEPVDRDDVNVSRVPSGDQRGFDALNAGVVKRTGEVGSAVETSQISLCRRFSSSTSLVRTKATRSPLGEIAGEPTLSRL